jgi:hypothetical protein
LTNPFGIDGSVFFGGSVLRQSGEGFGATKDRWTNWPIRSEAFVLPTDAMPASSPVFPTIAAFLPSHAEFAPTLVDTFSCRLSQTKTFAASAAFPALTALLVASRATFIDSNVGFAESRSFAASALHSGRTAILSASLDAIDETGRFPGSRANPPTVFRPSRLLERTEARGSIGADATQWMLLSGEKQTKALGVSTVGPFTPAIARSALLGLTAQKESTPFPGGTGGPAATNCLAVSHEYADASAIAESDALFDATPFFLSSAYLVECTGQLFGTGPYALSSALPGFLTDSATHRASAGHSPLTATVSRSFSLAQSMRDFGSSATVNSSPRLVTSLGQRIETVELDASVFLIPSIAHAIATGALTSSGTLTGSLGDSGATWALPLSEVVVQSQDFVAATAGLDASAAPAESAAGSIATVACHVSLAGLGSEPSAEFTPSAAIPASLPIYFKGTPLEAESEFFGQSHALIETQLFDKSDDPSISAGALATQADATLLAKSATCSASNFEILATASSPGVHTASVKYQPSISNSFPMTDAFENSAELIAVTAMGEKQSLVTASLAIVGSLLFLLLLIALMLFFIFARRKKDSTPSDGCYDNEGECEMDEPLFDLDTFIERFDTHEFENQLSDEIFTASQGFNFSCEEDGDETFSGF